MSLVMNANVALAVANAALALVIGSVYLRNHREIRSGFTLALTLFAAFFVIHNALLAYHLLSMMMDVTGRGAWFLFAEGLLQAAALGALAWATWR